MMIRGWQKASGAELTSKYRNQPIVMDGRRYASRAEAARAAELQLLLRAGQICDLEYQPRYPLVVNGVKICTYVADFRYFQSRHAAAQLVVEDVKGVRTREFMIKKNLMKALWGIDITEIPA